MRCVVGVVCGGSAGALRNNCNLHGTSVAYVELCAGAAPKRHPAPAMFANKKTRGSICSRLIFFRNTQNTTYTQRLDSGRKWKLEINN